MSERLRGALHHVRKIVIRQARARREELRRTGRRRRRAVTRALESTLARVRRAAVPWIKQRKRQLARLDKRISANRRQMEAGFRRWRKRALRRTEPFDRPRRVATKWVKIYVRAYIVRPIQHAAHRAVRWIWALRPLRPVVRALVRIGAPYARAFERRSFRRIGVPYARAFERRGFRRIGAPYARAFERLGFRPITGIWLKERGQTFENSYQDAFGRDRYFADQRRGQKRKLDLFKWYAQLARPVDLSLPYIYVALHFQPERTTSSLGGVFVNQLLMVDMLARLLPPGWQLYVKEHPSQFYPAFAGERSRHPHFYRWLAAIPRVTLVPLATSPFHLIDGSRAVATVTGTSGFEALVRRKPVLMFGYGAWYRLCHGVFYVAGEEACRAALSAVVAGVVIDPVRVRQFLKVIDEGCACVDFGYNTSDERSLGISYEESVRRLTEAADRFVARMERGPGQAAALSGASWHQAVAPTTHAGRVQAND